MIIQCPACQTKFSVDDALLETVQRPRFQCSQCGKYFEGSQAQKPPEAAAKGSQLSLLESDPADDTEDFLSDSGFGSPLTTTAKPSWPEAAPQPAPSASADQEPTLQRVELEQPAAALQSKPVVEKRLLSSFTDKVAAWPEGNTQPSFEANSVAAPDWRDEPEPEAEAKEEEASRRAFIRKRQSRLSGGESRSGGKSAARASFRRRQNDGSAAKKRSIAPKSLLPTLLLAAVPLLLFGALYFWSRNLDRTPPALSSVLAVKDSKTPQVPPITGLEVIHTSSQLIALDDGSRVLEVSGKVLNSTVDTFKDIRLEAKTYSSTNSVLDEIVVPAFNGLTQATDIKPLRRNSIRSLQQKTALGDLDLKPNQSLQFRLILDSTMDTAWYSVRVYSVGRPD